MARTEHSAEKKAAVLAELVTGAPSKEIADRHGVKDATVRFWRAEMKRNPANLLQQDQPVTKARIGDLLIEYVGESLLTLRAQNKMFANKEWLSKQSAAELSGLHAMLSDKAVRMLEAMGGEPNVETPE